METLQFLPEGMQPGSNSVKHGKKTLGYFLSCQNLVSAVMRMR